jgi:predicted negative regulator of RcsB-dependent stress response
MKETLAKILVFLSVIGFTGLVGYYIYSNRSDKDINVLLSDADRKLAEGNTREATALVNSVNLRKLSRYEILRVIKRAYVISSATGNYKILERVTRRAANIFSTAEDIWAFYVKALLQQGKYEKARKIALEHLGDGQFYSIKAEAMLMAGTNGKPEELEKQLMSRMDASFFERTARSLNNPVLFYDAALLWLRAGNVKAAESLLPFIAGGAVPSLGKALIAYDTGHNDLALNELRNPQTDYFMVVNPPRGVITVTDDYRQQVLNQANFLRAALLGDLYMEKAERYMAYESYLEAVSVAPEEEWQAWLNVVVLAEQLQLDFNSIDFLVNALRYFPNQKYLTLALTERLESKAEAAKLLEEFLILAPNDADMNLYRIQNFEKSSTAEKISSDLWNLFNYNSYNRRLAQYMVWFFLGIRNEPDARLTLERYKGEDQSWLPFYYGLIEAAGGNFSEAENFFDKAAGNVWEVPYNIGVIKLYNGQNADAIGQFALAKNRYMQSAGENIKKGTAALIESRLAEAYLANNQFGLARETAENALKIDENSIEARAVLRRSAR